jgi:hypothetical protein
MQDLAQKPEKKAPLMRIDGRTQRSLFKKDLKVTLKMRLWMKKYIETGNAAEAARQVYRCSEANASRIGYENVTKMNYQEFLEIAGLTDALITKKLIEGMESVKIHSSHTEPDKVIPDMATRHKYLETTAKLKKRLTERDITIVSDKTLILDALDSGTKQEDTTPIPIESKPA